MVIRDLMRNRSRAMTALGLALSLVVALAAPVVGALDTSRLVQFVGWAVGMAAVTWGGASLGRLFWKSPGVKEQWAQLHRRPRDLIWALLSIVGVSYLTLWAIGLVLWFGVSPGMVATLDGFLAPLAIMLVTLASLGAGVLWVFETSGGLSGLCREVAAHGGR